MTRTTRGSLASVVIISFVSALGAAAPEDEPKGAGAGEAPSDSLARAALADSAASGSASFTPFEPKSAAARPFLVPTFDATAESLGTISVIDAFLLPPKGPGRALDRADIRLLGHQELAEFAHLVPGLFALRSGYPGTTPALSFRARGPEGTMLLNDGLPVGGAVAPLASPNPISFTSLAGLAVMRAGASHLYGPGAGAGAILFLPVAEAPERAVTEVTRYTGVFGQRGGSVTTALRTGRAGVLFDFEGAGADPFSVFEGHRGERYHGSLDVRGRRLRVRATARHFDERLRGFLPAQKRSENGHALQAVIERRFDARRHGALRVSRTRAFLRADGLPGFALREHVREGADLLLRRTDPVLDVGVLAGVARERVDRRDVRGATSSRTEETAYGLARVRLTQGAARVDAALRYDRTHGGRNVVAAGVTLARSIGAGSVAWVHVARTSDRPVFFHSINGFYTEVDQGTDRPLPAGLDVPTGRTAAAGVAVRARRLRGEVFVSVDRTERVWNFQPAPHRFPLDLDEPLTWRTEHVRSAGVSGSLVLGPVRLPRWIGSLLLGGSGHVGSTPELRRLQVEPWRYGEAFVRLRRDLFAGSLRLEGELAFEALGEMPTFFGDLWPQHQITGRAAARIGDAIVFYRSANVLPRDFLSSARDPDVGYVRSARQDVVFGLSWVLVD